MSALDFPSSPATGQIFQQSESQPAWMWDGSVWMMLAKPKGVDAGGFRNLLINGNMEVYRRNFPAAGYAGGAYLADRWQWWSQGTNITVTWPDMSPGAVLGCEARKCLQMAVASVAGAGNYGYLVQKIEHAQALVSNEPYTLSFWANSGATARSFAFEVFRYYGTGGSPSAADTMIGQKVFTTVANLWTRFTHTFTMPSLFGKTLGSGGDDMIQAVFWLDAGSTYAARASNIGQQSGTWQITGVQLERGVTATPFERRAAAVERMLCQRYYNSGVFYEQFASPSTGGFANTCGIEFPTTMRATPTMVRNWGALSNVSSTNVQGTYPWCHYEQLVSVGQANISGTFTWEASAEL